MAESTSTISTTTTKAKNAYVSVLYHEEFMMGIRVLGSSLKRSQTPHDKYLLVTPNVPVSVVRVLEAEGWIVRQVQAIANPHGNHRLFLQRLNFVFTKLNIYRLTEYEKVVILDADTMLISNVDELFACNDLCAVVRNGFFNAGVMVIRPSESLYKELTDLYQVLPSYNGGEQGFLNQWFSNFSFCPYFDEARLLQRQQDPAKMDALANLDREHLNFKEVERCGRLSTQYNGDVGLYYTNDASWFVRYVSFHFGKRQTPSFSFLPLCFYL
jgi:alpha-N-acetylglucosamine transferase